MAQLIEIGKTGEKHVMKWSTSSIELNLLAWWEHLLGGFHEWSSLFVVQSGWKQVLNGSLWNQNNGY